MQNSASIDYLNNSTFDPNKHLNNSELHVNEEGSYKLNNVFLEFYYYFIYMI